jgi:predicted N-formylglutamate amidohydrolase
MSEQLLQDHEPPAFHVLRPGGGSPYVLVCDHASARVPKSLGNLGLSVHDLGRHIAWDIGAASVTSILSERLDASAVLTNYSRLVIDANRPPGTPQSIVSVSEATEVPGNRAVTQAQRTQRERVLFHPYHDCIRDTLDRRAQAGVPTALCSVHSFTPKFLGEARPWHVSVLYNRDPRLGRALRDALRQNADLIVGDNEPYSVSDATDHTVVVHGERRGIPYLMIELRQDLIEHEPGQLAWAERLAEVLPGLLTHV